MDIASKPADIVSKGIKVEAFVKHAMWLSGPHFLLLPGSEWPVSSQELGQLSPDDPELKKIAVLNAVQTEEEPVPYLIQNFSSRTSLNTSVAWIL